MREKHTYKPHNTEVTINITDTVIKKVETFLTDELLKRGFTAPITVGYNEDREALTLTSQPFQTVPVIFKSINIAHFNSAISYKKDENGEHLHVWMPIHVDYRHFDGGTNGARLFEFIMDEEKGK